MEVLKFRAWGRFGSQSTPHMIYDWQDSELLESVGFDGGNFFEIMQFTGLKDKNGKEIYEGDVVKAYRVQFIVEYWQSGFFLRSISAPNVINDMPLLHEENPEANCEVIGNIYENRELLDV